MKYMRLKYRIQFIINTQLDNLKSAMNRIGAVVFSGWHFINHDCICTIGKVLKINRIYTFKESKNVDIVRLLDVYKDKGYIYCTLYFFNENKVVTVNQIMRHYAYVI
jgi:hypothetical protein